MNVRELSIVLSKAAGGYADTCEVISISRFGVDGSSMKIVVDAGFDGDTHEQILFLHPGARRIENNPSD